MSPRQTVVNTQPGIGVAGDFCDTNPRYTADFGPGGAVAGPGGVTIGLFVWATPPSDADGASAQINNFGSGQPLGVIAREQQGLITQYFQDAGMLIPQGFECTVFTDAGFFMTNSGSNPGIPGMKAYANFQTGAVTFAAAGAPTAGATSTASAIAPETSSVTATVLGNLMTVSAVASGALWPGEVMSGTGIISGTTIASQVTPLLAGETLGGVGRYLLSSQQPTITSETLTGAWGQLTVGGTIAGSFQVGDVLSGAGVTAGSTITAQLTGGAGAAGTYVTQTQTVASEAIDVSAINVETNWTLRSYAAPGNLGKVTRH